MKRAIVVSLVCAAAAGGYAAARTVKVKTGTRHGAISRPLPAVRLVLVAGPIDEEDGGAIAVENYGSPPREGERYSLIDGKGWLTDLVIDSVEVEPMEDGTATNTGYGHVLSRPLREDEGVTLAIGPVAAPARWAHVETVPDDSGEHWMLDLDADGQPDVVQNKVMCPEHISDVHCHEWSVRDPVGHWSIVEREARYIPPDDDSCH